MKGRDKKGRFIKGDYTGFGFKKGHIPWSKGKHPSIETIRKISGSLIGKSKGKENAIKGSEKIRKSKLGEGNPRWKGGKYTSADGYVYVLAPGHPYSRANYVAEHRLIIEKLLGRYLRKKEAVHHRNKIRNDNRPENLSLVTMETNYGKVKCPFCEKEFIIK